VCVLFSAHQAAGSHNAQAFRTPFRGRTEATIWRGDFEEKARETKVASPGADKPGAMTRVFGQASGCLTIEERNREAPLTSLRVGTGQKRPSQLR
jgi:hypothetical protein